MPYGDIYLGHHWIIGSGNGVLPYCTKALLKLMLSYHQRCRTQNFAMKDYIIKSWNVCRVHICKSLSHLQANELTLFKVLSRHIAGYFLVAHESTHRSPFRCLPWEPSLSEVLPSNKVYCVCHRVIWHRDISRVHSAQVLTTHPDR